MVDPHNEGIHRMPVDLFLRGYFYRERNDLLGPVASDERMYKNFDFLRLRDAALHLLDPRPGKTILDLGCAEGSTMLYCGLQGAVVYGQDWDPALVAQANALLARYGVKGEARCGDAGDLSSHADNSVDGVIASDFFEHVSDAEKVRLLKEAARVLRPGGVVVLKTPNLAYLRISLFLKQARAVLRLQNPLRIVIPHTDPTADAGHPQHIGLATRFRLARCLQEANLFNYQFSYSPLRRFGRSAFVEILSTEVPIVRDWLSEDLLVRAYKPIVLSHFPD